MPKIKKFLLATALVLSIQPTQCGSLERLANNFVSHAAQDSSATAHNNTIDTQTLEELNARAAKCATLDSFTKKIKLQTLKKYNQLSEHIRYSKKTPLREIIAEELSGWPCAGTRLVNNHYDFKKIRQWEEALEKFKVEKMQVTEGSTNPDINGFKVSVDGISVPSLVKYTVANPSKTSVKEVYIVLDAHGSPQTILLIEALLKKTTAAVKKQKRNSASLQNKENSINFQFLLELEGLWSWGTPNREKKTFTSALEGILNGMGPENQIFEKCGISAITHLMHKKNIPVTPLENPVAQDALKSFRRDTISNKDIALNFLKSFVPINRELLNTIRGKYPLVQNMLDSIEKELDITVADLWNDLEKLSPNERNELLLKAQCKVEFTRNKEFAQRILDVALNFDNTNLNTQDIIIVSCGALHGFALQPLLEEYSESAPEFISPKDIQEN